MLWEQRVYVRARPDPPLTEDRELRVDARCRRSLACLSSGQAVCDYDANPSSPARASGSFVISIDRTDVRVGSSAASAYQGAEIQYCNA